MGGTPDVALIARTLLALAAARGPDRSFCPSEAARALADDRRALMPRIRAVAARLQADGQLHCTQRGRPADPATARGPIRLRAGQRPGPP